MKSTPLETFCASLRAHTMLRGSPIKARVSSALIRAILSEQQMVVWRPRSAGLGMEFEGVPIECDFSLPMGVEFALESEVGQ